MREKSDAQKTPLLTTPELYRRTRSDVKRRRQKPEAGVIPLPGDVVVLKCAGPPFCCYIHVGKR